VQTIVVVTVLAVLSAAVILLAAGLVEIYAELRQVREVVRLQDSPKRVRLDTLGRKFAELLPDPPPALELNDERPHYVLVLSNSCAVCRDIAQSLATTSREWDELTVLVASDNTQAGAEFVKAAGLRSRRLLVDARGENAKRLGINSSPTIVKVADGQLADAANLTSLRQLELFIEGRFA
jgi:hypothetical protein